MFLFRAVAQRFFQQNQISAEFKVNENQAAQRLQRFLLIGGQIARSAINDAECAERVAILVDEGSAGVEANVRIGNDKWIIAKTLIGERIGNNENIGLQDGGGAKGNVSRCFRSVDANARLEPLAIFVDQGNQRHGCLANIRS